MNVSAQLALMNLQSGSYLFRTAVIAFAFTFVLVPPQKGGRGLLLYLVRFLAVAEGMLLFTFLFSLLLITRRAPITGSSIPTRSGTSWQPCSARCSSAAGRREKNTP